MTRPWPGFVKFGIPDFGTDTANVLSNNANFLFVNFVVFPILEIPTIELIVFVAFGFVLNSLLSEIIFFASFFLTSGVFNLALLRALLIAPPDVFIGTILLPILLKIIPAIFFILSTLPIL